jgi:SHS2 domain-containing protein
MGFREIQHTADWALKVWAADLPSLFSEAARGMNSLAGAQIGSGQRVRREVDLHEADAEGLLVTFLSELLYFQEQENMGFDEFDLRVSGTQLGGLMEGAKLQSLAKPIKAVTYNNLKITCTARGCQVELVFDV